jgi:hypothetical protein
VPAQRATQTPNTVVTTATVTAASSPTAAPTAATQNGPNEDLTRSDEQGAVVVKVKPLNLGNPGETLDFDVALETHSVELSMDLASLATLTTDNGRSVPAGKWDGPTGGHHVEGKLLFPANQGGMPVLEDAIQLTLTLRNVDVPERIFTWDLK